MEYTFVPIRRNKWSYDNEIKNVATLYCFAIADTMEFSIEDLGEAQSKQKLREVRRCLLDFLLFNHFGFKKFN